MSTVKQVTKQSFEKEVLKSPIPVLIDFHAPWCGPCRMLAPILERLSVEFGGRVKIVKVDVDDEPTLARAFQVQSIPTMVFLVDGEQVARTSGLLAEEGLRRALTQLAGPTSSPTRRVG